MINALIGEELLPVDIWAENETGIVVELHYGERKRITLYPKQDMWEGGDPPFDLEETTSEEIAKYEFVTINATEEEAIGSKCEKMVIYWPLELLKEGIALGYLPEHYGPEGITLFWYHLYRADAIVHAMNGVQGPRNMDRARLTELWHMGCSDIITAYTRYDLLEEQCCREPEKLKKITQAYIDFPSRYSSLGEEAVHFLDSRAGLRSKIDGNKEAFRRSGYEGLEKYLERYLVEKSGTDRIKRCITSILTINRDMLNDCLNGHQENRSETAKQLIDIQNTLYHISGQYKFDIEF